MRSLDHWLHPLDGCPRCGYAYQREPGYFLLAIWGINFGVVGALGMAAAFLAEALLDLSPLQVVLFVIAPVPLLSLLFARHSKALFLALDHWFDPQGR